MKAYYVSYHVGEIGLIEITADEFEVHLVGGKMTATFYELKKKLFYTDKVIVAAVDNVVSVVELK